MKRRDLLKAVVGGVAGVSFTGFAAPAIRTSGASAKETSPTNEPAGNSMKKYDNDYFYKDGVFQED